MIVFGERMAVEKTSDSSTECSELKVSDMYIARLTTGVDPLESLKEGNDSERIHRDARIVPTTF